MTTNDSIEIRNVDALSLSIKPTPEQCEYLEHELAAKVITGFGGADWIGFDVNRNTTLGKAIAKVIKYLGVDAVPDQDVEFQDYEDSDDWFAMTVRHGKVREVRQIHTVPEPTSEDPLYTA